MPRAHFTLLALSSTTLLASMALACASQTVATRPVIEQVALVPAPSGPHAIGVPLREHRFSVEGAFAFNHVQEGRSRQERESGHIVVQGSGRGRVAVGLLDNVEVGFSGEYHGLELGVPIASDTSADVLIDDDVWRLGPQLRVHGGNDRLRVGGLLELEMADVPFARTIYDAPSTDIFRDPADGDTETFRGLIPYARIGFFCTSLLLPQLSVSGGGIVQSQPVFFGYDRDDACSDDGACSSRTVDVEYYEQAPILTLFGSVSFELEPITLIAQLYGHVAGDPRVVEASRAGGELVVRWSM